MDDDWDVEPSFGPPIFRATSKAISVKLSNREWVSVTRFENITMYLDEDGKIVQTVIEYDTGDPPVE